MKEDILEQLVDDYLMLQGYFTRHNLRFKPSDSHSDYSKRDDAVASDIDVIGYNPLLSGPDRVVVVSCKSWQGGFDPKSKLAEIQENKTVSGKQAWKHFRELCRPKWSEAFVHAVQQAMGTSVFTYWIAVAVLRNAAHAHLWEENESFRRAIGGNPLKIMTLEEILGKVWTGMTQTPASSGIGRTLQLMKAAKWKNPL